MPNLKTLYQASGVAVSSSTVNQIDPHGSGALTTIEIDITVTALSAGGAINFTYYRMDSFGNSYPVWTAGASALGVITESIGPGMNVPKSPGSRGYLAWTLTGTTPTATFTVMIQGR